MSFAEFGGKNAGMNSNHLRFTAQVLAAAAAMTLAGCQSGTETTSTGTGARVAVVQGSVRGRDATHSWRKLNPGDTITVGQLIQTAVTSSADLAVADAPGLDADRIILQSDTVVLVEGLPGGAATGGGGESPALKLDLRQGELTFTSPLSGKGPACEIRFAKGLAQARGATFNLGAGGEVKVFRGVVALKSSDGKTARTVAAGNQYDPQTGALSPLPPGETVAPLAPPPARRPPPPLLPPWPTRKY